MKAKVTMVNGKKFTIENYGSTEFRTMMAIGRDIEHGMTLKTTNGNYIDASKIVSFKIKE